MKTAVNLTQQSARLTSASYHRQLIPFSASSLLLLNHRVFPKHGSLLKPCAIQPNKPNILALCVASRRCAGILKSRCFKKPVEPCLASLLDETRRDEGDDNGSEGAVV
uniref:Uncharacterized protein n=1 Tax=Caenorhabditis japonica TaxID=281687 RepID=A0A8R1I9K9_CAEJA